MYPLGHRSDAIIEEFPSENNSSVQVGPTNFKHLDAVLAQPAQPSWPNLHPGKC